MKRILGQTGLDHSLVPRTLFTVVKALRLIAVFLQCGPDSKAVLGPPLTYESFCLCPWALDGPVSQGGSAEDISDSVQAACTCLCLGLLLKRREEVLPVSSG